MRRTVALALSLASIVSACGSNLPPEQEVIVPDEQGKGDGGTEQCDPTKYPCGPFGFLPGSKIENLSLPGRNDADGDGSLLGEETFQLELSRYYQAQGVKALVITASAEWCGPCQAEQPSLKALYNDYKNQPNKVGIMEAVIQNIEGGPADWVVAERWSRKFGLPFDVVVDPTGVLSPYYDISAFPMNMVIRTKDMSIVWQKNGLAEGELRQVVQNILAEE